MEVCTLWPGSPHFFHPQFLVTTNLLSAPINSVFKISHTSDIIWCLSSSVWLISFNIMSSGSTHIIKMTEFSSFSLPNDILICICHIFIHPSSCLRNLCQPQGILCVLTWIIFSGWYVKESTNTILCKDCPLWIILVPWSKINWLYVWVYFWILLCSNDLFSILMSILHCLDKPMLKVSLCICHLLLHSNFLQT